MEVKGGHMITLANLFKLSRHRHVDGAVLDELFALERSTLITTMLLEAILLYILVPLVGNMIIAWYGVIMAFSLWRLYNAYDYHKNPQRNTLIVWHEKFVVQVWLTALLFSGLALYVTPQLDAYYQLFTFMVVIGISSGTVKALGSDHRTAIGALIIILLPLMLEMLLLGRKETLILAFLVAIYFFVQLSILFHSYSLSLAAREAQDEIEKTRALLWEKQKIIQHFFDQSSEALFLYNREKQLLDCNRAFEKLFRISAKEVSLYTIETFPNAQWVAMIHKAIEDENRVYFGSYRTPTQETLWLETSCMPMEDTHGGSLGGIGLIKDKTSEHVSQQALAHMAWSDPMTGLSNRRGFQDYMAKLFEDDRHASHASLFFYLDVNKFKQINDRYGHEAGDTILVEVAKRLERMVPDNANLTRLGGDEFCMVIPHVAEPGSSELTDIMEGWLQTIQESFEKPFSAGAHLPNVQCSIGAVFIEPGETDVDKVVAQADLSMLQAKQVGSGGVVLYSAALEAGVCQAYEVRHTLGDAIEEEQLQIFYQPIVREGERQATAAEALVRWQHPQRGLLVPDEFLSVAIRSGQVRQVDRWMLHGVLDQIARWKAASVFGLDYISINVDVQSLTEAGFVMDLLEKMAQLGIEGREIRLELSESSLVEHLTEVKRAMDELSRFGVACIIDDYGTGCLSFFHLKDLPIETIKIDRIFVQHLTEKIENIFLIQMIIDMARKFRYETIVKGIESEEQRRVIAKLDEGIAFQGSLDGEPLHGDAFFANILSKSTK